MLFIFFAVDLFTEVSVKQNLFNQEAVSQSLLHNS